MKKLIIILMMFLPLVGFGQDKILIRSGRIVLFQGSAINVYNPSATALFNRMLIPPDANRKALISKTIDSLQYYTIWDSLDVFYMYAAHEIDASLLNWKNALFTGQAFNSPAFSVDTGWTGNGSNTYINTNYNPYTDAINYKLAYASYGIYCRTDDQTTADFFYGVVDGADRVEFLVSTSTLLRGRINSSNLQYATYTPTIKGMLSQTKVGTKHEIYRNDTSLISDTKASTAIPDGDIHVLAINDASPNSTNNQISCFWIASGLSDEQIGKMYEIVEYYMDQLGVGVVNN